MLLHVSHLLLFPSPSLHQQHSQQLSPPPSSLPSSSSWPSSSPFPGVPPPTPQQHRLTSSSSSISRSIFKVRTRRLPSGGTTASRSPSLFFKHTHDDDEDDEDVLFVFCCSIYVRLCCVFVLQACPSLLYIIHICSLLKYCLVSFQQHTTLHTHTERLTPPTSLTTHVHLNTHTISHTHPWKEDHKDRDLKYYLPPQQHQPTSPLRICNNVSTGNENKSLKLSHRRRRVERPFSERGALCGAWKIRGTL